MTLPQRKANGKFLLTGEYAVLDGAIAVAVPLQRGQWLELDAEPIEDNKYALIHWQALDQTGTKWFEAKYALHDFAVLQSTDEQVAYRLRQMLVHARSMNPTFLSSGTAALQNLTVTTRLDFDRNWGLGTSSTLIALIADWAGINPYQLLEATMGGSGYDIACASADGPITYQRNLANLAQPKVVKVALSTEVTRGFYFIYLNQKMNSREAIRAYRAEKSTDGFIREVSDLSRAFVEAKHLPEAQKIMTQHETLLGDRLGQEPVQSRLFRGFPGAIKSMGAWGGDFVLAATEMSVSEVQAWCAALGYHEVYTWHELALG